MKTILISLFLLFAVNAHAGSSATKSDILFLDLNNSPKEVEAAREAAKKSGRNLVVFPDPSPEMRKRLSALDQKVKEANKKIKKVCQKEGPECEILQSKRLALYQEQSTLLEGITIGQKELSQFLKDHKGPSFSSVVVSGHDGTGDFSGAFGGITDEKLAEELNKIPEIRDSIRSLHLWGCYTTSPGSLMLNWKKYFPNVSLFTGYEGRAPLADKPAGWQYLKGVLAQETELIKSGDSQKLQALLKQIPGASQVNSAIFACDNYASLEDNYNIAEIGQRCDDLKPEIEKQADEFMCYLKAKEDRCANPPADVGSGSVRVFYNLLQKASACSAFKEDQIFRAYSRDSAIRLVFSPEVQRNFGNIYARELVEIDAVLAELGAPADLRFAEAGHLTRKELLLRADRLLTWLSGFQPDLMTDPGNVTFGNKDAKMEMLADFQQKLTGLMAQMSAFCVPFNWTEPNQKEESICLNRQHLGLAAVQEKMNDLPKFRKSILQKLVYKLRAETDELLTVSNPNGIQSESSRPVAQAKLALLNAQSERLQLYLGNESPPDGQKKSIEDKIERARLIFELTQKGDPAPEKNPKVLAYTLANNGPKIQNSVTRLEISLESIEAGLRQGNFSQSVPMGWAYVGNSKEEYEAALTLGRIELEKEKSLLEATQILQSDATWDSTTGKSRRLSELKEKIGKLLDQYQRSYNEQLLNDSRKKLAATQSGQAGSGETPEQLRARIYTYEKLLNKGSDPAETKKNVDNLIYGLRY